MTTVKVNGQDVPVLQAKVKTIIKHKETGKIYKDEEEWKNANISPEDIRRDVIVRVPRLDLFAKTK